MCKYFSAILMRDGTVLTFDESNSHDDIISANGLKDVKLKDRDFIRIEITPREPINLFSTERSDWIFKEDEEGTLPSWYDEGMMSFREKCWRAWESSIQRLIHDKIDVPKLLSLINEVKSIGYMDNHDEPLPEWHLYETRDAVWNAVWGDVWDDVGDAVRDARLYVLVNSLSNMKQEHIDHISKRMEVWKRGYGCYCDVNEELYCYKNV